MDLNVSALVGVAHLVPIALTLRKVFAPSFDTPAAFAATLAKLDGTRPSPGRATRRHARSRLDLMV